MKNQIKKLENQIKKNKRQIKNLHKQLVFLKEKHYNDNIQYNLKKVKIMENQENQIDILDVAQYILNHQNKEDYTRMKIQKLVFFVYCKYLVDFKKPLFPNDFESWEYGPVSPKLYLKTLSHNIYFKKGEQIKENFNEDCFTINQKRTINYILRRYGTRTVSFLVKLTHKDKSPWRKCFIYEDWSANPIYDSTITKFYSKKNNAI